MTLTPRVHITGGSCYKYNFLSQQTSVCWDKKRLLSRQKYARDKTFFSTKLCYIMTKVLSPQIFVFTNTCLPRQKFCRDKRTFVATKDVFCHDKYVFVATKMTASANDIYTVFCVFLQHFFSSCIANKNGNDRQSFDNILPTYRTVITQSARRLSPREVTV